MGEVVAIRPAEPDKIAEITVRIKGLLDGSIIDEEAGDLLNMLAEPYYELLQACGGDEERVAQIITELADSDHGPEAQVVNILEPDNG